ncbi:preprotein translocase, SecA subunit [Desulfofarcimen acetoxidans DSM 771]|uniref:Protein translocase subunit SecA n=1 Tax=Desulfofarcimen acetoxidans (strain ATCC 49208 / DSM 771 / KCTC 5769 / VKM B-1644 / 5575) TaxID=485916 RepID=C8VY35_DESAS|nr:preprotein translocase subunit SecA [Desulfofarcimen acetoxidans]ACV64664.1 preprotein translocase, SecA subunit [Desulfofarcimen acetoxidans DSM 771]
MLRFIRDWFDDNAREVKKLQREIDKINALEAGLTGLADQELQNMTIVFRDRLERGEDLNNLLPEAFALVREASRRVLGMRHFDVQLIGGMVLHQGRIAEMKTGEGKTLVATLPVYLNALTGQGVHVVTVNDYLARRDSEWMGHIYKFLGLSVGLIVHGLDQYERKTAYGSDITYGTNNEFGFDYLRDNMAVHPEHLAQRQLNYAIVDEVDSILIDEARTPLIISGQADKATDHYYTFAKLVPRLTVEKDYTVDEKAHTVALTEEGVAHAEKLLGVGNLFDDSNMQLNHYLNQALKAHALMKKDRDYVVKEGQVIIVDEFTGRLMFGRRYSDGLHQSIEAKEGVHIERESQTLATITFQNYFRMYNKLAGMTGTAATEEEEFRKIYGLDVVVVPTNKDNIRKDMPDVVYKTENAKFNAAVEDIAARHANGQPILVGTISIEKSEVLSAMLKRKGVPHQVLNAKFHEKEAEIVAQAGRFGAVTIATNMAGRGTDILLGGNPEFLSQAEIRSKGLSLEEQKQECAEILEKYRRLTEEERNRVLDLGGLHIMGTERHESRRIDNQLRGRGGRQGDPGSSQFFSSLEDDLMRLFGAENISGLMDKLGLEEDVPIEHVLITKSIETAQKRVESRNFDARKHVLQYDDVMNQQRELIYKQRREVLAGENMQENVRQMIEKVVDNVLNVYAAEGVYQEEWDLAGLLEQAEQLFLPDHNLTVGELEDRGKKDLRDFILEKALDIYNAKEAELGYETMRELERVVILKIVDEKWMDHLDAMDQLREGVGLRAYGQKDPLVEYKFEGYEMFQNMIDSIQEDVVRYVYRVVLVQPPEQKAVQVTENRYEDGPKQPVRKEDKVGRNDQCPCGSGKKYKKCCGRGK